jgi:hypothetical protein
MDNLITQMHQKHKEETNKTTLARESHDPIAVFLAVVLFVVTMIGVVAIPLTINSAWIGLVEVVWFFAGFGWTGKLLEVKNRHDNVLARSL